MENDFRTVPFGLFQPAFDDPAWKFCQEVSFLETQPGQERLDVGYRQHNQRGFELFRGEETGSSREERRSDDALFSDALKRTQLELTGES